MEDRNQKQKQTIPSPPEEVVREILSRLPVKSLLRLKGVCKSWNTLINDPYFIELHLNQTLEDDNLGLMLDLVNTHDYKYSIKPNPNSSNILLERLPELGANQIMSPRGTITICGSCNGLLLLSDKYVTNVVRLELWNPTTREATAITCFDGFAGEHEWECFGSIFGLGYDLNMDDYKVIRIHNFLTGEGRADQEVTLYSVKSGTWSRVQVEFNYQLSEEAGKCVNGGIYWIGRRRSRLGRSPLRIVCFDCRSAKSEEIPLPCKLQNDALSLGVWKGRLCLYHGFSNTNADIYVMKKRCWFKVCTVCVNLDGVDLLDSRFVCLTKDGKVLLEHTRRQSDLVLYDHGKRIAEKLVIDGVPEEFRTEGYFLETYVKTLVQPYI